MQPAESAVERIARLMSAQGVGYMTAEEAASADARHDVEDARRERARTAGLPLRPPPIRQGKASELGPRSFDVGRAIRARPEPEVQLGLSWGKSEAENGHCGARHVADAVRICPQLDGLDLDEVRAEEVTPFELAEALRALRARPPGIVRTTHVAFLFGIIATRRRGQGLL